eukprot:1625893-Rhodomonas_salina.2
MAAPPPNQMPLEMEWERGIIMMTKNDGSATCRAHPTPPSHTTQRTTHRQAGRQAGREGGREGGREVGV